MFTKPKGPEGTSSSLPSQDAIRPASSKPNARIVPSIISADMKIVGSVESQGEMTIDGKIDGDVKADSMTIGVDGEVVGEIIAQQVTVRGKVKGSIRARKVELEAGARVYGDIVHARLSIQNDAIFEGQVKHADDPLKAQTSQTATIAPAASVSAAPSASASTTAASATSSTGPASSGAMAGSGASGTGTTAS